MTIGPINETLYEGFLTEASGVVASTSTSEVVFELIIYSLMAVLAFQICREISKLYLFIEYEGLRYFKNAFFFYGTANFLLSVISLSFLLIKFIDINNLELLLLIAVFAFPFIGISFWIAKANLLASITWKLVEEEYVPKKKALKFLFFSSLLLFVMIDVLIEILISILIGTYAAFGYRALIFILILLLIRSNMLSGEKAKPITHPYYLALILLFTVSFLSNALSMVEGGGKFDLLYNAVDLLTLIAYTIIFKGIKKWSRILVE
ncbi:MAG: hypothetical protein PHV51_06860 [Methanosarcinaceae archaeon]|nr:hypothetical protein [Methanosarcinaceae archaeon]MDD4497853.1 hypothetical protein [Methanosarcinaceae archaeon]